jgi:hypothetical protein
VGFFVSGGLLLVSSRRD